MFMENFDSETSTSSHFQCDMMPGKTFFYNKQEDEFFLCYGLFVCLFVFLIDLFHILKLLLPLILQMECICMYSLSPIKFWKWWKRGRRRLEYSVSYCSTLSSVCIATPKEGFIDVWRHILLPSI